MFLSLALILSLMILLAQLLLCMKSRKRWLKRCPLIFMLLGELLCWAVVQLENFRPLPDGAAYAAYIYALILLLFLGADLLAWLLYILGKWFRRLYLRRAGK